MKLLRIIFVLALVCLIYPTSAQITKLGKSQELFDVDSIVHDFDSRPFFGLYKDNYFTVGTALNQTPNEFNSDVKFQVSFRQQLTKSVLPWHTHVFLFYSQKAMWNVFEESLPFHDLNFNPGVGITKLIISKGRLIGSASFILEHESNGRDGEASRSWNKVSLSGSVFVLPELMIHGKVWIPIVDGQNNKDILKYSGIFQGGAQFLSRNKRWVVDATLIKRQGWNFSFNTIINVGFRISRKSNQFLMLHFYDGYGENMLDYNKYHCRLRIGMLIRPSFFSDF